MSGHVTECGPWCEHSDKEKDTVKEVYVLLSRNSLTVMQGAEVCANVIGQFLRQAPTANDVRIIGDAVYGILDKFTKEYKKEVAS